MTNSNGAKFAVFALMAMVAIAAGFVISFDRYQTATFGIVAIVGGLVVVSLQLRNQFFGLATLVATAVAAPIQFGGDGRSQWNTSFFIAIFLCVLWLVDLVVLRRATPPPGSRVRYAAWGMIASALISYGVAQLPSFTSTGAPVGAQTAQLLIFVVSTATFLIAGQLIGNLANLKKLTGIFLVAGAFVCFINVAASTILPPLDIVDRVTHVASVGSVFWTWLTAMSLAQAIFNRQLSPGWRMACVAVTILTVFRGLLNQSWASGWVPVLIAVGVITLFRFPRLTIFAAGMVGVLVLFMASGISTFTPQEEEYSAMTRRAAAETLWPLILSHPLVGTGPANYYYHVASTAILGWYVRFNSHNQYLDIAAQLGGLGMLAYAWLVAEMGLATWKLRTVFRDNFCEAYAIGALAGLVATVISGALADWIFPFYYNIGIEGMRSSLLFWIFMSGIFVLRDVQEEEAMAAEWGSEPMHLDESIPEVPVMALRRDWSQIS
ncbi:MAG: O-antigen ligase family protein [Acidobacteriota bacterium]